MSLAIGSAILLVTALIIYGLIIINRRPGATGSRGEFWLGNIVLPLIVSGIAFGSGFVIRGLIAVPSVKELAITGGEIALFFAAWMALTAFYRRLKIAWQTPDPVRPEPKTLHGAVAGKRVKRTLRRAA